MNFVDLTFVPILEKLQDQLKTVETYVILTDAAHMPQTGLRNAVAYEDLLTEADDDFDWLTLDENAACGLCYTSGTTGNPKGVLYSHRSNVLHAMAALQADVLALSSGVSEPDLERLKREAPLIVARAAETERLDWQHFLQQGRQWLRDQAVTPAV